MVEPREETDDMNRDGILSVDAAVATEDGDSGATCFSDCGGPGEDTCGPEMDSLTYGPRIDGETDDALEV